MTLGAILAARIQAGGPITVAEFVELALYHPQHGYYTTASRRSGRRGDFFTSVDVGPLFGELLSVQIEEMWYRLGRPAALDLVEAAAGDGRLARDVLDAARAGHPGFYGTIRLHLVEPSPQARAAQRDTLGPHADRLATSGAELPAGITGVILANELLDALPPHAVVMREDGLHERLVDVGPGGFIEVEGPPSTPQIARYLERVGAALERGWRAEVNLAAERWVGEAARRLTRGFLMIIDYGHEAPALYSASHAEGTLTSFTRHVSDPAPNGWLKEPGRRDITAHVDLTGIRLAAEREGLETLAALDQTYFLLGLGAAERLATTTGDPLSELRRRLALKTLVAPGGIGSTHKVLIFGRGVGRPALRATSFRARLT
jgi:SAM-dependent MidA family methyltransferase